MGQAFDFLILIEIVIISLKQVEVTESGDSYYTTPGVTKLCMVAPGTVDGTSLATL